MSGTINLERNSNLYGKSFEQFIGMEIRAFLSYKRIKEPLCFRRSTHGMEADFLIGEHTAIEVKAVNKVSQRDLKGLKALQQEGIFKNYLLVSQDPTRSVYGDFQAMHYTDFLDQLWNEKPKNFWSHP